MHKIFLLSVRGKYFVVLCYVTKQNTPLFVSHQQAILFLFSGVFFNKSEYVLYHVIGLHASRIYKKVDVKMKDKICTRKLKNIFHKQTTMSCFFVTFYMKGFSYFGQ